MLLSVEFIDNYVNFHWKSTLCALAECYPAYLSVAVLFLCSCIL